jgi:aspartate-semialdehyde dehydrogenase
MRVCILGATGLVGQETVSLVTRAWPGASLALYASRDQTATIAGTEYEVLGAARLTEAGAPRGDLAFVALDDEHSKRYVPRLLELGYRVVDKSNTYRADPNVPLVVAGVNDDQVTDAVRLVANPNCTSIPLSLALAPLQRRFGVVSVTVSTYQAISGAGVAALDQFLADSQRGYAEPDRLGSRFDAARYAGNTVPHNGNTDASGFSSEERKLTFESRKILRLPELAISAQCCRVPVAVGHYENVWLTLGRDATLEEVAATLADSTSTPFLRFLAGPEGEGLSALACLRDRDRALVGRLRSDARLAGGRGVCLTVVGDNLRLGAATNAIRIASRWAPVRDRELGVGAMSSSS